MADRSRRTRSAGGLYGRLLVISLVSISVIVVATSPLLLDLFGGSADSWSRRGDIGQTYGAAAALLSVLALAGVAISLVLQARESKANREHASRLIHTDLLKLAMDDPAYLECWGPYSSATAPCAPTPPKAIGRGDSTGSSTMSI